MKKPGNPVGMEQVRYCSAVNTNGSTAVNMWCKNHVIESEPGVHAQGIRVGVCLLNYRYGMPIGI